MGYLDVFNRSRRLGREVKMNWQYVLRCGLVEWMAGYIPCTNFAHHPRGAAGTTIEHVRNVTARRRRGTWNQRPSPGEPYSTIIIALRLN